MQCLSDEEIRLDAVELLFADDLLGDLPMADQSVIFAQEYQKFHSQWANKHLQS